MEESYQPPPHPPRLLSDIDIRSFAKQGHMNLFLSHDHAVLAEKVFASAEDYFDQEDSIKREKYPQAQGTELGYSLLDSEKEYLTLRASSSDTQDPLEVLSTQLWRTTATLLHRILVDLSHAMDIDPSAWDPLLDGCLAMPTRQQDMTPTLLRIFNYFPDSVTAGRHVDNGLLTLCISAEPGLQVLDMSPGSASGDGSGPEAWRDVEGATLLAGSTLQVFSRDRIRAGAHRVVGNSEGRRSLVFALRPSLRHPRVDLTKFGGEGETDIRELYRGIKENRHNVNAPKELREQQKREQLEKAQGVAGSR